MSTEKNLTTIIELMQQDDSIDAPPDSIRWARNLFRARATAPEKSLVRKIAAVLQMEISPRKAALGERSATASQVRQLLFRADESAVDLRIEPANKGFSIRGQILGDGFSEAGVVLFDDANKFATNASELSEFTFESVPAGRYELLIGGSAVEISLKAIDVE